MKTFLITWGLLCLLVIVGLFIAYATDILPGAPVPQSRSESTDPALSRMPMNRHESGQVGLETEEACSPCEENLAQLRKVLEQQAASQERSGASTP